MAERPPLIRKTAASLKPAPNLAERDATCATFSWQQVREELQPGGGEALNMARLAVDRHAGGPRPQHTALRLLAVRGVIPSSWIDDPRRRFGSDDAPTAWRAT